MNTRPRTIETKHMERKKNNSRSSRDRHVCTRRRLATECADRSRRLLVSRPVPGDLLCRRWCSNSFVIFFYISRRRNESQTRRRQCGNRIDRTPWHMTAPRGVARSFQYPSTKAEDDDDDDRFFWPTLLLIRYCRGRGSGRWDARKMCGPETTEWIIPELLSPDEARPMDL